MKIEVFYEWVPADYIDHEFGRHHLSGYGIFHDAYLLKEVRQMDPETDETVKTWPAGTNVFELPDVKADKDGWIKYLQEQVDAECKDR